MSSGIGFSQVFLLLIFLVLGGVALVVVVVMRRGASEEGRPSRARRIGCVLLGIVVLVGAVIVFRVVNASRERGLETVVNLHGGTAQLFVGEMSVGIGDARLSLEDIELIPLTVSSKLPDLAEQFFPGQEVFDARAGASAMIDFGDRTLDLGLTDILVRGNDGRVDSAIVVVVVETVRSGIVLPTGRAFVVRARDDKNRRIKSGVIATGNVGGIGSLLGLPAHPQFYVDVSVGPTPTPFLVDGAEPPYVVDDYVTRGGTPTPR